MKGKAILFSTLAIVILFTAAAPVFACTPKCVSFTVYVIAPPNPSVPGTTVPTKDGILSIGTGSIDHEYSTLFGSQVAYEKDWFYLNTDSSSPDFLTGYGVATAVSSSFVEHDAYKLNGLGLYTYVGPTVTDGITTITSGEALFGILLSGIGAIQFTSGPYTGQTAMGTWSGVTVTTSEGSTYIGSGTWFMR